MGRKDKSRSARRTGSPIGEPQDLPTESEVSEGVYEVECIVAHRVRHGSTEYKVRWCGWSEEFDEWLDPSNMDCPEAVREYWEKVSSRTGVNQQRLDICGRKSFYSKRHVQSSKAKRKLEMDTQHQYRSSGNAIVDSSDTNGNTCDSTIHVINDKSDILGQGQSKRKERKVETVVRSSLLTKSGVAQSLANTISPLASSSLSTAGDISGNSCTSSVNNLVHVSTIDTPSANGHEEAAEVDMDVSASADSTIHAANKEPGSQKWFIGPHGFERGLTALIRGFEEHYVRCRQNKHPLQEFVELQKRNWNESQKELIHV
ncbi:unnamed protein product [Angiostrongylus costaricensis]|uniref:Chromo domain-containing protein n=1 Tax=Angiostrongylus costaricensis TaxID=334426 RepID=A0A158PIX4_ANGCS|nr:unnamed protein product [Angiostrongylus costaricensis]